MGDIEPLLIHPGTTQFVMPHDKQGIILIPTGDQVELHCHNGFYEPYTKEKSVLVKCTPQNEFTYSSVAYDFKELQCYSKLPKHSYRVTTRKCFNNAVVVEIGFQVDARFLTLFEVCHDKVTEQTYYTKYKFVPGNFENEHGVTRPTFAQGTFFPGKSIDGLYKTQKDIVAKILGSAELAAKYINTNSEVYLARGHMAAKADFVFGTHQVATFWYINAAPQWQTFNGHNWVSVEDGSRRLAGDRHISLEVYTGTYGVTTLKDKNNIEREIYLGYPEKKVPVPKLYYRILLNKADDSGVVFIGVNNPHLTLEEIKKSYILCKDVSSKINYLTWKKDNLYYGYGYACEVNEFVKAVPHVKVSASKLLV